MSAEPHTAAGALLAPDEPPPYEHIAARPLTHRTGPVVIVCDHAQNRIPRALGSLGVPAQRLEDHIAWDIGAAGVARRLAEALGADAVLAGYSRLVVDVNRALEDPSAFPAISDGVLVPGNLGLGPQAKAERAAALFHPYHRTIRRRLEALSHGREVPVLLAVHSFTPRLYGVARPWHVGVLWDKDPRLAIPLLERLRRDRELVVGDNEPYSGRHSADYTMDHHAEALGLAHASIEIRQDLIRDEAGQEAWAERLATALGALLADARLYRRLE
ncbi:MAG TPA: N-formylglutamate amidohydrolase [Gammaproteobacteria bacterium]